MCVRISERSEINGFAISLAALPRSECCFASRDNTIRVVAALLVWCRESEQLSSDCDVVLEGCLRCPCRYVLRFVSSDGQF